MKKNALMAKVHESALTILSGEDLLSVYEWNTRRAKHFFCSRCGIYTFHRKRAAPDHFGVNIFCLDDFDHTAIPVRATEGVGMSVVDENARPEWPGRRARESQTPERRGQLRTGLTQTKKRRLPKEAAFFDVIS
jgi:hypothetical protein